MGDQEGNKLGKSALKYWRLSGFFSSLFFWLFPLGYLIFTKYFPWPFLVIYGLIVVCLSITIVKTAIFPKIKWERWRYKVSEHDIKLSYGLWIRRQTVIPMVRVQHVDTKQGPLMHKFSLASVTISTAAGSHEIPALSAQIADGLRQQISLLARVVEEDV
ncbi:MAG TPA: PH domain-containing protein [Syntrophomonadaceae bacterium]|nr:PH domain-containing protein [Syntrophomonadaceae bacterium]